MKTLINGLALLARTQVGPFSEGGDPAFLMAFRSLSVFQSTPPRRGRRMGRGRLCALQTCFNPRPREGGDDIVNTRFRVDNCFNPRPREGGDLDRWGLLQPVGRFNPRPREGGDLVLAKSFFVRVDCFNPRPREGGDILLNRSAPRWSMFQSTPPRRGRQRVTARAGITRRVSIHAPAKGATRCAVAQLLPRKSFNPRPREGGDGRGF